MRTKVSALALMLLWPIATAAAPGLVTYQGRLTDPSGSPASGPVAVEFRIYDAEVSGTQLWSESHATVAVVAGLFKVELGASSAIGGALLDEAELWLEVEVAGETLTPRERIVAVPYALRAAEAETLSLTCASGDSLVYFAGGWTCSSTAGLANGAACTSGGECNSGFCTDGLCCDTACPGLCEACDLAGSEGACSPEAAGTQCAAETCNAAFHEYEDQCDGAGACADGGSESCSPYQCSGSSCATSCTTDVDCDASYHCSSNLCVPDLALGAACTSANQCASSNCVDGVCCNSSCNGLCEWCLGIGSGACGHVFFGDDPRNDCGSEEWCDGTGQCTNLPPP